MSFVYCLLVFYVTWKKNTMATNFEPHECVIFVQSTEISTHENKAIPVSAITW